MKILYIPDYYYLSNPIFTAIAKKSQQHTNIYLDTKFTDQYNNVGKKYFKYTYTLPDIPKLNIFKLKETKEQLEFFLEIIEPDVIVSTSDMGGYVNRVCNNWCEKNNIPYIIIQSAFLESPKPNLKDILFTKIGYPIFNRLMGIPLFRKQYKFGCEKQSNHLFLWGSDFKRMYKRTIMENNVHLVGNPVFDNVKQVELLHRDKPVALLCPSMFNGVISKENMVRIKRMYQNIINLNPDIHFVVKIHPRESIEPYIELFKDCGYNYSIMKDVDLHYLFDKVDVQISLISYSSFESLVFGIPIIILGANMVDYFKQFNHPIANRVYNISQFNDRLKLCLDANYKKPFLKLRSEYLKNKLEYQGNSAEHIVKEIEGIVK